MDFGKRAARTSRQIKVRKEVIREKKQVTQTTVERLESKVEMLWTYCEVREKTNKITVRTVTFTLLAPYNAAPHNRYQPHPAVPAQHTMCSHTRSLFS